MCSLPLKLAIAGPSELSTPGTLAWLDHSFTVAPPTTSLASCVNHSPWSLPVPRHAAWTILPTGARDGPPNEAAVPVDVVPAVVFPVTVQVSLCCGCQIGTLPAAESVVQST